MNKASEVKVLIAVGFGLNCEAESDWAWRRAGATVRRVHLADLFQDASPLEESHIFMLIGGFAYGDHIASGRVLATRLRYRLGGVLGRFVESGKLVLGVCNGFQTLVKTGLLPAVEGWADPQRVSLAENIPARFHDAWVRLAVDPDSPCIYTKGLKRLDLPIRHGEGRFVAESQSLFDRLHNEHLFPLAYADPMTGKPTETYPANPNGSPAGVAGLCDQSGRVFGLMPHPEAALVATSHPHWTRFRAGGFFDPDAGGDGQAIFNNAVAYAVDHLI